MLELNSYQKNILDYVKYENGNLLVLNSKILKLNKIFFTKIPIINY